MGWGQEGWSCVLIFFIDCRDFHPCQDEQGKTRFYPTPEKDVPVKPKPHKSKYERKKEEKKS
jgi:hypothetical protein